MKSSRPMMKSLLATLAFIMVLASMAAAETTLGGYWSSFIGGSRVNDEYTWNIWRPSQYFELNLYSGLSDRSEAFVKFGANWDSFNNPGNQPRFWLKEGHLKYRRDWGGKGFESYAFIRERRYWIGNHLLQLVDEGNVSNDNNGQGVRIDSWLRQWNATYVLSDFSNQDNAFTPAAESTDDAHILRLTRRFDDKGSYFGGSYLRRVNRELNRQYNEVRSLDFLWIRDRIDLSAELADSKNPSENLANDGFNRNAWNHGSLGKSFERWLPSDAAFRAEMRNLTLGEHRFGHYTINASYWKNGPDYRNDSGRDTSNRVGHSFHTYYRVPQRAVTYTISWGNERQWNSFVAVDQQGNEVQTNDPRHWFNQSLYVEFINGFKMTLAHNRSVDTFLGTDYEHFDWFGELIVENRLAWLKTQFKIKDWDTQAEKSIFGLETTLNMNSTWKWYNRYMVASDAIEARHMLYTQMQYRPHDNMEFFLSYGPDWYGDWGELTNDSDFESGGKMEDRFKLEIKTWF